MKSQLRNLAFNLLWLLHRCFSGWRNLKPSQCLLHGHESMTYIQEAGQGLHPQERSGKGLTPPSSWPSLTPAQPCKGTMYRLYKLTNHYLVLVTAVPMLNKRLLNWIWMHTCCCSDLKAGVKIGCCWNSSHLVKILIFKVMATWHQNN